MAEETKPAAAAPPKPAPPPGPPPPKNPGMVTFTIDGREAVVKPGTNVIEAAASVGVSIPYYCWHKRLSIAANCRMCLVEMSNAPGGKLMPACQMTAAEGVAVKTDSPKVKDQQRATLEFLLVNHPVDCPICDQSGECKLQDYYFQYDTTASRLDVPKVKLGKRVPLGKLVVLDQERCILCTRCVRFMSEVRKNPQLGVDARGSHSFITTAPGPAARRPLLGQRGRPVPGGRAHLHRLPLPRPRLVPLQRPLDLHRLRPRLQRLPRLHAGRHLPLPPPGERAGQPGVDVRRGAALLQALQRRARARGAHRQGQAARAAAVAEAAAVLRAHAGQGTLAWLASPAASLEDLLAAALVAREGLKLSEVYVGGRGDGWQDDFLRRADQNPNRAGLALVARAFGLAVKPAADLAAAVAAGKVKAVWAVGAELATPELAATLARAEALVVQAVNEGELAAAATVLLPASPAPESDGTFVNFEGRPQRFELAYWPRGESLPHWGLASELGRALGLSSRWASARQVFEDLGRRVAGDLPGFEWNSLPSVDRRKGLVPLAAGTVDGRLPGHRERMPLDGSGNVEWSRLPNP